MTHLKGKKRKNTIFKANFFISYSFKIPGGNSITVKVNLNLEKKKVSKQAKYKNQLRLND